LTGLAGLLIAAILLTQTDISLPLKALLCLAATALPMIVWTVLVEKVHLRPSTGLDFSRPRPLDATLATTRVKLIGLFSTWLAIGFFYFAVRYYSGPGFIFYFILLAELAAPLCLGSIIYVYFVDRHSTQPHDGLWHMGRLITGHRRSVDWPQIKDYARGWLIKAFFLAFMLSILPGITRAVLDYPFTSVLWDPVSAANLLIRCMFFADVCFGTVGYILTLRLLDSHVRSANPYLSAWVAALICYPPFILMGTGGPLNYHVGTQDWSVWFVGYPLVLTLWGVLLVTLAGFYAWATVAFGYRFSNLTHRGIITNGPYRYFKHPAYLSKNLFWWLAHVPVLSLTGTTDALRNCILLLSVNVIYYLRAKTEERHLKQDDAYVAYLRWIEANGVLAKLRSRFKQH
jgi:protein-S-isoprenylcysteine O-methyltransferase Ste14